MPDRSLQSPMHTPYPGKQFSVWFKIRQKNLQFAFVLKILLIHFSSPDSFILCRLSLHQFRTKYHMLNTWLIIFSSFYIFKNKICRSLPHCCNGAFHLGVPLLSGLQSVRHSIVMDAMCLIMEVESFSFLPAISTKKSTV